MRKIILLAIFCVIFSNVYSAIKYKRITTVPKEQIEQKIYEVSGSSDTKK